MERSEQIGELISALAKAQADFGSALKESNNPFYSSKYADLATVISAVRPALNKHGIALMHLIDSDLEHQTATVTVSLHCGEQFISQSIEAPAVSRTKEGKEKFDVQTLGAAWSYLRRYSIQAITGLASEDDDGNSLQNDNKPIAKARAGNSQSIDDRVAQASTTMYKQKVAGPTPDDFKMWHEAFDEVQNIEDWNKLIVPMMRERADHPQYGRQFIIAAAEEAKKRGYVGDRTSGAYKLPAKKNPQPTSDDQGSYVHGSGPQ